MQTILKNSDLDPTGSLSSTMRIIIELNVALGGVGREHPEPVGPGLHREPGADHYQHHPSEGGGRKIQIRYRASIHASPCR